MGEVLLMESCFGDIPTGTIKTITYQARVNAKEFFNFGTNNLINSALVYNTGISIPMLPRLWW